MGRFGVTLCLSLSVFAVALAGLALIESAPEGGRTGAVRPKGIDELRLALDSLRAKVEEIEARQGAPAPRTRPPRERVSKSRGPARAEPAGLEEQAAGLEEQVAALTRRVASLEDGETIARLAQSGEEQVVQRELESALDRIANPEAAPEERLEALGRLRGLRKEHWPLVARALKENEITEQDLVMPMLELAQDTRLAPELRAEVLHGLESKMPELRQPLLDLFTFEESPEVREGSLRALMWHLEDVNVRDAIRQASQNDRHDAVLATARKYLPKVEHFDHQAAEAERAGGARSAPGQAASPRGKK